MKKWLGIGLSVAVVVTAVAAPWLAPRDPLATDSAHWRSLSLSAVTSITRSRPVTSSRQDAVPPAVVRRPLPRSRLEGRLVRVARAFAELEEPLDLLCASPAANALETARILESSVDQDDVLVLEELSPRASPRSLLRALSAEAADHDGIALVGHKRQFQELLTMFGVRKSELPLRKGAIVRIDVDSLPRPRVCIPRFRLRPSAGELRDAFCGLRRVA